MAKGVKYPQPNISLLLSLVALACSVTIVALTTSGALRGPRGQPGACPQCNVSESFAIAYNGGMTLLTDNTFANVVNWSSTVDTLAFPDVPTSILYTDLASGVLNLAAGTFTVGAAGVYDVKFNSYMNGAYVHLVVDGVGNAVSASPDTIIYSGLFKLQVGDVVRLTTVTSHTPLNLPRDTTTQADVELPTYALIWSMIRK